MSPGLSINRQSCEPKKTSLGEKQMKQLPETNNLLSLFFQCRGPFRVRIQMQAVVDRTENEPIALTQNQGAESLRRAAWWAEWWPAQHTRLALGLTTACSTTSKGMAQNLGTEHVESIKYCKEFN